MHHTDLWFLDPTSTEPLHPPQESFRVVLASLRRQSPTTVPCALPSVFREWSSSSEERQQSSALRFSSSGMPARGCCADLLLCCLKKVPGSSGIWMWAVKTTTGPRQALLRLQASAWRLRLDWVFSLTNLCLQTHINVNPKQTLK